MYKFKAMLLMSVSAILALTAFTANASPSPYYEDEVQSYNPYLQARSIDQYDSLPSASYVVSNLERRAGKTKGAAGHTHAQYKSTKGHIQNKLNKYIVNRESAQNSEAAQKKVQKWTNKMSTYKQEWGNGAAGREHSTTKFKNYLKAGNADKAKKWSAKSLGSRFTSA